MYASKGDAPETRWRVTLPVSCGPAGTTLSVADSGGITGPQGFERTVTFAIEDDPVVITERVREAMEAGDGGLPLGDDGLPRETTLSNNTDSKHNADKDGGRNWCSGAAQEHRSALVILGAR